MSRFKYIFPVFALLFLACDSDDDGFYNTVYVQATNLVSIENPAATYNVGDVIQVEAHIPRLLPQSGEAEPLDVRATTHADSFQFTYFLEKKNASGEWITLDVTDDYVSGTTGSANVEYFVQAFLDFEDLPDSYLYSGGIELTEAGQYRLNFSNNTSENFNKVFLRSNSENNNITINIFSTSANLDASGMFEFTVN